MNKKGFTLIELLVTIAVLAVISLISFVSVTKVIQKNKVNNCETIREQIKMAAKQYISDNRYNSSFSVSGITAKKLIDNGYLKNQEIKNPFTNTTINAASITLSVTLTGTKEVKTISISSPNVLKNCTG